MTDYMKSLREFHTKFAHTQYDTPVIPPLEVRILRQKLIMEEGAELFDAMTLEELPDIAKELADLLYVVFGTALAYGIDMDAVFNEVHNSNMTKSKVKDHIGKTVKGESYKEPDIASVLYPVKCGVYTPDIDGNCVYCGGDRDLHDYDK